MFLITVYAPVDDASESEKDKFWCDLNDAINENRGTEQVIVAGDLNSRVGMERDGVEELIGKYGYPRMNGNWERLLEICAERGLFVSNTFFRQKAIHQYT